MLHPEGMVVPLSTAFLWTSICVPGTTGHLYCISNKRERFVAKPSVYLTNRTARVWIVRYLFERVINIF